MAAPSRRALLLQAANAVARREGAAALTLDAVAAEAGVSKGGLLYHFPTKEALILGLLEDALSRFDTAMEEMRRGTSTAGAYLAATAFGTDPDGDASLIPALAQRPELMEPLQQKYQRWTEKMLQEGLDPVEVWICRLVADGLWLSDTLRLTPPDPEIRAQIVQRLHRQLEKV